MSQGDAGRRVGEGLFTDGIEEGVTGGASRGKQQ
jgi:hypothetical protein